MILKKLLFECMLLLKKSSFLKFYQKGRGGHVSLVTALYVFTMYLSIDILYSKMNKEMGTDRNN
jgi:hypothetical protein